MTALGRWRVAAEAGQPGAAVTPGSGTALQGQHLWGCAAVSVHPTGLLCFHTGHVCFPRGHCFGLYTERQTGTSRSDSPQTAFFRLFTRCWPDEEINVLASGYFEGYGSRAERERKGC